MTEKERKELFPYIMLIEIKMKLDRTGKMTGQFHGRFITISTKDVEFGAISPGDAFITRHGS